MDARSRKPARPVAATAAVGAWAFPGVARARAGSLDVGISATVARDRGIVLVDLLGALLRRVHNSLDGVVLRRLSAGGRVSDPELLGHADRHHVSHPARGGWS